MPSVLITSEQAEPLAEILRSRGLHVVHVPLVSLVPTYEVPPSGHPDGVLVTSAAVARFVPDLKHHIRGARVVAVGHSTAKALSGIGVKAATIGKAGGVEALRLLKVTEGQTSWYVGAETPSPRLDELLLASGVDRWSVYRNEPVRPDHDFGDIEVDVVCFTSGSAARSFFEAAGVSRSAVAVIGPSTGEVVESLGMPIAAVALRPTLAALAEAVVTLV